MRDELTAGAGSRQPGAGTADCGSRQSYAVSPYAEYPVPETQYPAPETQYPVTDIIDPAPDTLDPAPETSNPIPDTRNPTPGTRPPAPETLNPTPSTSFMLALQGAALVLAGILTSAGYMLAPSFSKGLLFFLDGKESAYVWSGAAGVAFGMGLARLASYLKSLPRPKGSNHTIAIVIGSFIASLIAATQNPLGTLEFFIMLFYILPCSMLSYGIATGRLWAVVTGIFLDLLIGLGSPSGTGRDPVELAIFAALFLATLELAYSSATYKGLLDRELAEAPAEPVRRQIARTVKETVGCYYTRLAAGMLASSLAVAAALMIFSAPGLFGEAYGASIEARKITALLLPGLLVLGLMSAGLLVPQDILERTQNAAARARRLFTFFGVPSRLLSSRRASQTPSRR